MRVRAVLVLIACCSLLVVPARAEDAPKFDAAISYVFLNAIGYGNNYHAGWAASVGWYPTDLFGVAGEVGGSYKSDTVPGLPALNASIYNFMAGPKVVSRRNSVVSPFAQALFGDVHVGNNLGGYVNDFASQFGGSVDFAVERSFAVRVEGDYRLIATGGLLKEFRFTAGVVFIR